jgi:hypothetical protein
VPSERGHGAGVSAHRESEECEKTHDRDLGQRRKEQEFVRLEARGAKSGRGRRTLFGQRLVSASSFDLSPLDSGL